MNNNELESKPIAIAEHLPALVALTAYLLLPLLLMPLAGDWLWPGAWILLAINVSFGLGSRLVAMKRNPGILLERGRSLSAPDTKAWDKLLVRLVALIGPLAMFLVAGMDKRFIWTLFPSFAVLLAGTVLTVSGSAFASWALVSNPFFSGTVRIQRDRGHHVINDGPYRWLRHPGYSGAILSNLGLPLLLDSWWAFLPVLATSAVFIVRTKLEDRTLTQELQGYDEYRERVPYRLLPFLW